MRFFTKKRLLYALVKSIIVLAMAHFLILTAYFLATSELAVLNIFNILDLYLFFPRIAIGSFSFLVSIILLTALYAVVLILFTEPD